MGAFIAALGKAVEDRALSKIANKHGMGAAAMQQISPGMYSRYRGGMPMTAQPPGMGPTDPAYGSMPDLDQGGMEALDPGNEGGMDAMDPGVAPMAEGALVTRPTKVLLAEKGPEMVVPLNNNPDNKTNLNALMMENAGGYRRKRMMGAA